MGIPLNLLLENWQNKENIFCVYKFILLVLVVENVTRSVAGRKCYECSSTNSSGCISQQKEIVCEEQQNSCLTIQYQYKIPVDGKYYVENKVKKKCGDGKFDCNLHCRLYRILGKKNCQVSCCNYNLCNGKVKRNKGRHSLESEKSPATSLRRPNYYYYLICMVLLIST